MLPAGPVRARVLELLIWALSVAADRVGKVRSTAGFVADQVRCRTRAHGGEVDPVDQHAATAVRTGAPSALPPPLSHLEVLAGEDLDVVLTRVIALGRPDALTTHAPGSWTQRRVEDEVYVDERRRAAALQLLDRERIELVRRSS